MLKTTIEPLEGSSVKLTITVPAEQVDEAVSKAYENVGKKIRIPGFRKGKAPRPVVDNYVGKDYVRTQATEELVDETYSEAIDAEELRPIDSPDIEELDLVVEGEDFTYSATVELRPELTVSSTDGIAVEVPVLPEVDAEIDEQIEQVRDRFASLEPVEDRGIEAGDFALISFVGDVAGEPYEGNVVDKYLYELGRGQMPAEFDAGLLGMKPDETKRIEFEIPDTSSNPEFVGKTAGFEVTVHEVKAKVLPEVDDEFAISVGGYDSVEGMREDLRGRLEAQRTLQHDRDVEGALRAAIAERLEGEVPAPMINAKVNQLMRNFESMLEQNGMTVEAYAESVNTPLEVIEADFNRQGELAVREDLALEALFRAVGLDVTDEEVDNEIASMASSPEQIEEMKARWAENGLLPILRDQVIRTKAIAWLRENATVTEVAPEAAEGGAEEKPKGKKKSASKKAAAKDAETAASESTEE